MFTFFNHNRYLADLLGGFRDIHCHLLPAVDDGCPDSNLSLRLLDRLHSLGVEALYMTPHIISGAYDDRTATDMRQRFAQLDYQGPVDVRLAAEYFVDEQFLGKLNADPLTMNDRHILVEFSLNGYSLNSFDILFEAEVADFQIILAHPERYSFLRFDDHSKSLDAIKHYALQLNLLSVSGFYGNSVRKMAMRMLDKKLYTFIGTDIHSDAYVDALEQCKVSNKTFDALYALAQNNRALF